MTRSVFLLLLLPSLALAQFDAPTRYELGQRLRLFDRALAKHQTPDAIARALPPVEKATPAFFSGRWLDAARILDTARLTLADAKPEPARRWALSLVVRPAKRLVDASDGKLTVTVDRFYKVDADAPEKAAVRLLFAGLKPVSVDLAKLPASVELKWDGLAEGDHELLAEVVAGDRVLSSSGQTVSVIEGVAGRLAALKKLKAANDVEGATRKHLVGLVEDLAAGKTLETNYPAHRLFVEAEALAKAGGAYYSAERPGQFWLALPGVAGSPVRVEVPAGLKKGAKVPVVVALHGAGGSENMFFDAYGDGLVARLAVERGWLVVSPRSGLFSGPDVPAVLDALAKVYPIDASRAFVVGHSMGAAQAASAVGQSPKRFAAAACLGGGGGVKPSEALRAVPVFVGVGKLDFAAPAARRLADGLKKAGVEKVTLAEYDDVEHLTVVQLALPRVFAFFDAAAKR